MLETRALYATTSGKATKGELSGDRRVCGLGVSARLLVCPKAGVLSLRTQIKLGVSMNSTEICRVQAVEQKG